MIYSRKITNRVQYLLYIIYNLFIVLNSYINLVIKLKNQFELGKIEFREENYEKALSHFESVDGDDDDYEISLFYRIPCLIHLKRYAEALSFINPLIEKNPNEFILWYDKARCHALLKEDKKAYSAMEQLERVVDTNNKNDLLCIAKLYNFLHDDLKVVEYTDKALAIDENYRDALYEKSFAAFSLDDDEMIEDVSKKLYDLSDKSLLSSTPMFLMKLFNKNYRGALDLLDNVVDDEAGKEHIDMLKAVVYEHLTEDLSAQLMLSQKMELDIDDALKIMFDFKDTGRDHGEINGVTYFIL